MKKGNRLTHNILHSFLLALAFTAVSSCVPTHRITIEILVPADEKLPLPARDLVLINRSLLSPVESMETGRKTESQAAMENILVREVAAGFAYVAANSPAVDSIRMVDLPPADSLNITLPLDRQRMDSITGPGRSVLLVCLEYFTMSVSSEKVWRYGYITEDDQLFTYYGVDLAIASSSFWRTLVPSEMTLVDEFWQNDTLLAESEGKDIEQAVENLPDREYVYMEAAFLNGYNYARRILPHWVKADRFYYKRGSRNMREGHYLALDSEWTGAAEIWRKETTRSRSSLAAKAWFNMAVVAEILDKLELALELVKKSQEVKVSEQTELYINLLEQRMEERRKLLDQIV